MLASLRLGGEFSDLSALPGLPALDARQVHHLTALPGFWQLPAVVSGDVFVVDHSFFSCPGPRLVQGVEILAKLAHPGAMADCGLPQSSVVKLHLGKDSRRNPFDFQQSFRPYS